MLQAPISPLQDFKLGPVNHIIGGLEDKIQESLGNLISSVCSKTLKSNYKEVISEFKEDYSDLRAIFEISVPNKVHFLQDHLEDQLNLTGEGLGEVDDGVVEAMHQYLDKRMKISNYLVKNLEPKARGEKKLKLVE